MRLESHFEFARFLRSLGHEVRSNVNRVEHDEASGDVAERLEIERGSPLLVVHKLFLIDDQPAIYVVDTIPQALIKEPYDTFDLHKPIFTFLEDCCSVRTTHSLAEVVPRVCGKQLAVHLDLKPWQALLQLNSVFFGEDDAQPVLFSRAYYKDPLIRFHVLRRRVY